MLLYHFLILFLLSLSISSFKYNINVTNKSKTPILSHMNPKGEGYSDCKYVFNPAWLEPQNDSKGLDKSILITRVANCSDEFGGTEPHLMYAVCEIDGFCSDLNSMVFNFTETVCEDPRVFYYQQYWYMFYYASGTGQNTVYLRRSATPLDPNSWELVASGLPWHRNGCTILRDDGNHYVIFGESNGSNNTDEPEIVIEASTIPVQLSTGDYLHIYAAGTPGWVKNGNYTAGFIILDAVDPSIIVQRSTRHEFMPTMDYEIGDGIYPVQRYRTLFVTSIVPIPGLIDTFRVFYGAADANTATAILTVTYTD